MKAIVELWQKIEEIGKKRGKLHEACEIILSTKYLYSKKDLEEHLLSMFLEKNLIPSPDELIELRAIINKIVYGEHHGF